MTSNPYYPKNLQYFRKKSGSLNNWEEILNENIIFKYVEASTSVDSLVLKSIEREQFYVELTNSSARWGDSTTSIKNKFAIGTWVKGKYFKINI